MLLWIISVVTVFGSAVLVAHIVLSNLDKGDK